MASTKFSYKGVNYDIPVGSGKASENNLIKMIKFYIDNGREPTDKEMKSAEFTAQYGRYTGNPMDWIATGGRLRSFHNAVAYLNSEEGLAKIKEANPNIAIDPQTGLPNLSGQVTNNTQQTPVEQNVQGMYDQIYQSFYDRAGVQYQQGIQNLGREQQQAGIANASERQKMLDGIRNYRRSALKSGLSSAQISANELQSTLISQDLMNQNQRQLGQQRSNLEQEFAMRGPNASLETWNMMNTGNLPSVYGQSYAAQIADPMYQSIWLKNNPQYKEPYKTITKPD